MVFYNLVLEGLLEIGFLTEEFLLSLLEVVD